MVILPSYLSPGQTNIQNSRGNAHYDTIIGGDMWLYQINRLLQWQMKWTLPLVMLLPFGTWKMKGNFQCRTETKIQKRPFSYIKLNTTYCTSWPPSSLHPLPSLWTNDIDLVTIVISPGSPYVLLSVCPFTDLPDLTARLPEVSVLQLHRVTAAGTVQSRQLPARYLQSKGKKKSQKAPKKMKLLKDLNTTVTIVISSGYLFCRPKYQKSSNQSPSIGKISPVDKRNTTNKPH